MVKDFLLEYATLIAQYPDKIKIECIEIEKNAVEIIIYTDKSDLRRLIGKDGRMINSIKTVLIGYKAKDPTSYKITVKAIEE